MKKLLITLLFALGANAHATIQLHYDKWELGYNCEKRGYEYFHYKTVPDQGALDRVKPFHKEDKLPKSCQQFSTKSYKQPKGVQGWDRGHGVHSNIWDHSYELMRQSNSFANIAPS